MSSLNQWTPRALASALQHAYKKSLGQNFLIDENITRSIAQEVQRFDPTHILEIGPGAGALSVAVAKLQKPYVLIEKDDHCAGFLKKIFADTPNVSLIHDDALSVNLPGFCYDPDASPLLVSNLPYNVASQIYFRFIDQHVPLCGMVLMFQKEVALRFTASPGTNAYGILSVLGQYYHEIESVMDVYPDSFEPAPKVTSTVLRFIPKKLNLNPDQEKRFRDFVHAAFRQRRKTLSNSLAGFDGLDKSTWTERIQSLGYPPSIRAENLEQADFMKLAGLL